MKEIVVISGKGGTGKTSLAAAFAVLEGENLVVADCDVDAADMHLLLDADFSEAEDFESGELAVIDQDRCTRCGKCASVCRFDAILNINGNYVVDPLSCEGCGYCSRVCPPVAIRNEKRNVGKWFISNIKSKSRMVHARLSPGADNSGKLVAHVRNKAKAIAQREKKAFVLVDGSPGVGCPVVSSLSGAHYVVLVTEPTVSGLHDLKRVYELVHKFGIRAGCIINKSDINKRMYTEILDYCEKENIGLLGYLPFEETFVHALSQGLTITEYNRGMLKPAIEQIWKKIKEETEINNRK